MFKFIKGILKKITKIKYKVFFTKNFRLFFASYFLIFSGFVLTILSFGSTIASEYNYYLNKVLRTNYVLEENDSKSRQSWLNDLIKGQTVSLNPVTQNSIVIEKIGVSAPIILNVSVVDENEYFDALKKGVAHAVGKSYPGEIGNVYLFAHSSIEFWKMGPYATVFNQIRRLENGDIVHIFYKNKKYDYVVFEKKVVSGFDLLPYEAQYNESILTLQTCDPPGTQLNRLIVKARLINDN